MCSNITVKVNKLSKCYHIYEKPEYRLRQLITSALPSLFGPNRKYYNEFWALHDISFEIKKGETLGIIGRNGSGKSTLLQLIAGTLAPTDGSVQINGRVAALLELGSGFNPEFTGRENVYLNASVLGLTHEQIDQRFHQIAAFADIGAFIDQPVKTYSSGMYVRLAFAVVAHVDADILIVDEALAVGDAVFTQKCMRFIRDFQENGTLLFVSHDLAAVQNLCERAIWLSSGELKLVGNSKEVAQEYLRFTYQELYGESSKFERIKAVTSADNIEKNVNSENVIDYNSKLTVKTNLEKSNGWRTGNADIISVALESISGVEKTTFEGGEFVELKIHAYFKTAVEKPIIGFIFKDRLGQDLFGENTISATSIRPCLIGADKNVEARFRFRLPMLPNGQYAVSAAVAEGDQQSHIQHSWLHEALIVTVSSSKVRWGLVGIEFDYVDMEVVDD
jgi:lipopolysaccharide transport system ATP-binding protein